MANDKLMSEHWSLLDDSENRVGKLARIRTAHAAIYTERSFLDYLQGNESLPHQIIGKEDTICMVLDGGLRYSPKDLEAVTAGQIYYRILYQDRIGFIYEVHLAIYTSPTTRTIKPIKK